MPVKDKDKLTTNLAKKTEGYTGADLEAVAREAGMLALRESIDSKEVLKKHSFTLSDEDYIRFCPGRTDEAGFKDIVEKHNLNIDVEALCKEKSQLFYEVVKDSIREVLGATELIKNLNGKFRLGLVQSRLIK